MTPPNKPEWIQLAEADSVPQVKKSARALPALVLTAAMSIVGLGALVAQNGAETPAEPSAPSITASLKSNSVPNPSVAAQPNTPKLPAIAAMPTGGGDDDDEEDDDDDDEEDDDEEGDEEGDDH